MVNRHFLAVVSALALLAISSVGSAQNVATPQLGIVPNGSYETYHVDAVNMDNGNDIIKIPLFSLPQLGKLALSFSIVANTATWQPEENCPPDGSTCTEYYYDVIDPIYGILGAKGLGPEIVPDNFPLVDRTPLESQLCHQTDPVPGTYDPWICERYDSTAWTVHDGTGGSHPLYYDSTNVSNLRTTDGSGFIYSSGLPNPSRASIDDAGPFSGQAILTDSHGIKNTWSSLPGTSPFTQTDLDGNSIEFSNSAYTDTVGRVVPPIPQATTSNNGNCPNIGQNTFQPVVSSAAWQIPGPNNTTATYLICYAAVTIRTEFFTCAPFQVCYVPSGQTDEDGNPIMVYVWENYGTSNVIQSIVLPDGSYYGFIYDAADPNNSSDIAHYGTLSRLIFPVGGSIAYKYGTSWNHSCDPFPGDGPFTVSARTISDGNGHIYQWTYHPDPIPAANNTSSNISSDSNGNDTVYQYRTFTPNSDVSGCGNDLEISRKRYKGPSTNGNLLRTVATTYQTAVEPGLGGPAFSPRSYGNAFPQTVTTTLDAGISTTTSTGYSASSFSAVMPTCAYTGVSGPYCQPFSLASVNLSLGIPTSTSTTDYSSGAAASVLRSSTTEYAWQDLPGYLSKNLLDVPYISTNFNGNSTQVAQTTTTPDAAGNPTSVWRWNNNGSPVVTHTAWTAFGMVNHAIDANGNIDAQYIYGPSSPCSSSYPSDSQFVNLYPTAIKNALGQTTTYTWDCNTGQVASVTDPNGVITNYFYTDPRGRLTKIQAAAGTPSESWKVYQYPSSTEVDVFQDQNTKGDGLMRWVTQTDGLGRVIHQTLPNGSSMDTQYDGFDQVLSVSNPYLSPSDPTFGFTSFAYDALGRKTLACNPDNGTGSGPCVSGSSYKQWSYAGNVMTSYDELRKTSQQFTDALGRLTNVTEPGNLSTTYQYDALGNLWSTNQAGNGTVDTPRYRSFTYDSLSRLLTSTNPETGTICYGIWSGSNCMNGYDANGNLKYKTDNRNITTNYLYDPLNRLTGKSYSGADPSVTTTAASCYEYDATSGSSMANAVGRLVNEWSQPTSCPTYTSPIPVPSSALNWKSITSYDAAGRVQNEVQCPLAPCSALHPVAYTYDLAGNLTSSTNGVGPSASPGILATYNYDSASRLSKLYSTWDDATHPATLFEADQATQTATGLMPYGPLGLLNAQLGVSSQTPQQTSMLLSRSYDNRARLTGINLLGNGASSGSPISLSISPSPVSFGVSPFVTSVCGNSCGSGGVMLFVDGIEVAGSGSSPGLPVTWALWEALAVGNHSIHVIYIGDTTHAAQTSSTVAFTVIPNLLPATTLSAQVSPAPVPAGESGEVDFTLNCNSSCSSPPTGDGYFLVDGGWGGGLTFDENGTASNQTSTSLPVGTHTLTAYYYGSGQYAESSYSGTFTVTQQSLPTLNIVLTVAPSPIPANEYAAVSITSNCSSNCGAGHLFVDGMYAGGFNLNANGSDLEYLSPLYSGNGPFMTPGSHTITADYFGNASYAPSNSTSATFTVVSNNLPAPIVTASVATHPISSGQPSVVNIHIGCTPSCSLPGPGLGGGHVMVDGNYAGTYFPDSNGDGVLGLPNAWPAGPHSLVVQYFGNLSYTYANSAPVSFTLTQ